MILNETTNVKGFYRFVKYISAWLGIKMPHERLKNLVFDDLTAEAPEEYRVKAIADSYLYLINSKKQILTKAILKKAYYLLEGTVLGEDVAEQILTAIYIHHNEVAHISAAKVHLKTLKLTEETGEVFAYMLSNTILLKKGRGASIPRGKIRASYKRAIECANVEKLAYIFMMTEQAPPPTNSQTQKTRGEVIKILGDSRTDVVKNYGVKKMYLYGSYAKNNIHPHSDVDVLVIFGDALNEEEKLEVIRDMKRYYLKRWEIHVDIINFNYALFQMCESEMQKIITVF